MKQILSLIFLLITSPLMAQLTVSDRYDPYQPIIAGCNCIVPESGSVQFMWQVDPTSKATPSDDNKKLYIWAPPGNHTVEAVVAVTVFNEMLVWVPDPKFPTDITKATTKTVKTLVSFDVQRYSKSYLVGPDPGPGPTPPPGPGPGPGPSPTDEFAKQAYNWLKAVPAANYSKEKAISIADNYSAVAAQAVATSGWDLNTFVTNTKQLNLQKLSTTDVAAWGPVFFNPLATYQSQEFAKRGLNNNDTAGIAKLWRDTAEAIKSAATSISGGVQMVPVITLLEGT